MKYNIIPLIEKWGPSGLLGNISKPKDMVTLCELFEKSVEIIKNSDSGEYHIGFVLPIIYRIYTSIYTDFSNNPPAYQTPDWAVWRKKLKDDNHKIDVEKLITDWKGVYDKIDFNMYMNDIDVEAEWVAIFCESYIMKHGK